MFTIAFKAMSVLFGANKGAEIHKNSFTLLFNNLKAYNLPNLLLKQGQRLQIVLFHMLCFVVCYKLNSTPCPFNDISLKKEQ